MDYCVSDCGEYCSGDLSALCLNWVSACKLFELCRDLLVVNFSISTERDRAHSLIAELVQSSGVQGRFPLSAHVNLDSPNVSECLSQIQRALDFHTRSEEKISKETGLSASETSWGFDDAANSYYKGLKSLNRAVFSYDFVSRKDFEEKFSLIWV